MLPPERHRATAQAGALAGSTKGWATVGKSDSQAVSGEVLDGESGLATLSPAGLATFNAILSTVPDAEGGGYENILEAVAAAKSANDLDAPWQSAKALALRDVPLVIVSVAKARSDFEEGLGWYLIVRAAVRATGEAVTFMTGSGSILLQLAVACSLEQQTPGSTFPLHAIIRVATKQTPGGFYPMHLEIIR